MQTASPSKANDKQVGGTHYVSEFQHWDFAASVRMGYFPGVITKYLSRWRKKNGIQDLEKALHYLQKYSEVMSSWRGRELQVSSPGLFLSVASEFNARNGFLDHEGEGLVNMVLASNHTIAGVERCIAAVDRMLEGAKAEDNGGRDDAMKRDELAVDAMAARMKWQLATRRGQGRHGWETQTVKRHLESARAHVSTAIGTAPEHLVREHIAAAANYLAFAAAVQAADEAGGPGAGYVNQDR